MSELVDLKNGAHMDICHGNCHRVRTGSMMLPLWERGCRMETKSPSIYEFECDQGWKVKIELHQSRYGSNTPSWVLSDSCKNKAW